MKHGYLTLLLMLVPVSMALTSCMTRLEVVWSIMFPEYRVEGESTKKTPAKVLAVTEGVNHASCINGAVSLSQYCKIRTQDGSTYKAELFPQLWFLDYFPGQEGIAEIGCQSNVLYSFMPHKQVKIVERYKQLHEEWRTRYERVENPPRFAPSMLELYRD